MRDIVGEERPAERHVDATVPSRGAGRRVARGRVRWPFVVLLVVALVLFVSSRVTLPYFAYQPGGTVSVVPVLHVPAGKGHKVAGRILLVDVDVVQVNLLDYLPDRLRSDTTLLHVSQVLGPQIPASQLDAQGELEMEQSQDDAQAAAFTRLGLAVHERDAGVVVAAVLDGTPAAEVLSVGDVVTAVGGVPTPDLETFVSALTAHRPGDVVSLAIDQVNASGVVTGREVRKVRLASNGKGRAFLGGEFGTQEDFTFPFSVGVGIEQIGGPSAGLAMTLGMIATLSGDDVTGGRTIAATGTIDPSGDVGDVGGVAQKAIAVSRAGATVFLVPPPELAVARAHVGPGVHVYAVSTLDQALADLAHLGGHVPPAPPAPPVTATT